MSEQLESGFVRHASPDAIEARLKEASTREHAAALEVNACLVLLRVRIEQIARGEWPTKHPDFDPSGRGVSGGGTE